jgi:hypothetical protein
MVLKLRTIVITFVFCFNCFAGDDIPDSLIELKKIKDKKSVQYEIAAYNATVDLLNLGKGYLNSGDSAKALKYLSLGVHFFSYRTDLVQLKNTATKQYIKTTNALIKSENTDCFDIRQRVEYLKQVSPDNVNLLVDYKKRCAAKKTKSYSYDNIKYDPAKFLQISVPTFIKNSATESTSLDDQLETIVHQNTNQDYPFVEQLILGMKFIGNFSVFTTDLEVSSNSTNKNNFTLIANYNVDWRDSQMSYSEFCTNLSLIMSHIPSKGSQTVNCQPDRNIISGIHPSKSKAGIYLNKLNLTSKMNYNGNSPFNQGFLPKYLIFSESHLVNGKSIRKRKKLFSFYESDPTKWLLFAPFQKSGKNVYLSSSMFTGVTTSEKNINFRSNYVLKLRGFNKKKIKGLTKVIFKFDRNATYKAYMDIYKKNKRFNKYIDYEETFKKYL